MTFVVYVPRGQVAVIIGEYDDESLAKNIQANTPNSRIVEHTWRENRAAREQREQAT